MPSNEEKPEDEICDDIVSNLLKDCPFKIRPNEEKLEILKKGRPMSKLNIIKRDTTKNCNRTFQPSWYTIHKWLCGSVEHNKLFCWPCLLMRPETSSWCSTGNDDMKRFTTLATKHALCRSHLKAISEYDDTLTDFNLPPEFVDELNFKCKEEEFNMDQGSPENDIDILFKEEEKNKKQNVETNTENEPNSSLTAGKKDPSEQPKIRTKITFKNWQDMTKGSFPIFNSKSLENSKLYKWKRKLARQELRNARLTGEKLKYEIEVLKAKVQYYKGLTAEQNKDDGISQQSCFLVNIATDAPKVST